MITKVCRYIPKAEVIFTCLMCETVCVRACNVLAGVFVFVLGRKTTWHVIHVCNCGGSNTKRKLQDEDQRCCRYIHAQSRSLMSYRSDASNERGNQTKYAHSNKPGRGRVKVGRKHSLSRWTIAGGQPMWTFQRSATGFSTLNQAILIDCFLERLTCSISEYPRVNTLRDLPKSTNERDNCEAEQEGNSNRAIARRHLYQWRECQRMQ